MGWQGPLPRSRESQLRGRAGSVQDEGALGYAYGEHLGDEVEETHGVDRLRGVSQLLKRPPAMGPDVVGLSGPGRIKFRGREMGEIVALDLPDFPPAD